MNYSNLKEKFVENGWDEIDKTTFPRKEFYRGVDLAFSYNGKLCIYFYFESSLVRLMINDRDEQRCYQIECQKNPGKIVDKIISIQDRLSIETYLSDYSELGEICPTSILAFEQYM